MPPRATKPDTEIGDNEAAIQNAQFSMNSDRYVKPRFSNALRNEAGIPVFRSEMAAQGGIRDKILRVSMPLEKWRKLIKKSRLVVSQKCTVSRGTLDPWSVVLKVHAWAEQLKEWRVHSCAAIARREGITRVRVSQPWPLSEITWQQADEALTASKGRGISLRRLIRIARNPCAK